MKFEVVGPAKVTQVEADKHRVNQGYLEFLDQEDRGSYRITAVFSPGAWHHVMTIKEGER